MNIKITSDSTCDLGQYAAQRGVVLFPISVILDGKMYRDGIDITPEDIFKFVAETKQLPKTAAPSIADYEEFFSAQL
jgi:fatty acid-binding protein DegV